MTGYTWTVTGGVVTAGGDNASNFVTVNWTNLGTGNISVTFTDPFGCGVATPGNLNVVVATLPVPLLNGQSSICVNTTGTYTTDDLMSGYVWTVSAGGTITSGQGSKSVNVLWNTTGKQTVSVKYTNQLGCTAINPTIDTVTVNPRPTPVITGNAAVCINLNGTYTTAAGMSNYSWNVPTGGTITSGNGTNTITVNWNTAGTQAVTVNYNNLNGCAATIPAVDSVKVNPLPVATINGSQTTCQDFTSLYSYQTAVIDPLASYSWQILAGNGTITPSATSNPVNINWNAPGNVQLKVTATSNPGCVDSRTYDILVNPKPDVSMVLCFDNVTTRSAKRFLLKGGKPFYTTPAAPVQGEYISTPATPALVYDAPTGNYYFDPTLVPGNNTVSFTLSYQYTNQFGCPNKSTGVTVSVQVANPACGATMTDPRDGKVYATTNLGGRCWMSQNLNYPKSKSPINADTAQTDNCIVEKYCPPSDPACSTNGGAYYQWDELIQYANTDYPYQGLCPPGWHVPTSVEWQQLIDNADPSFTAPNANAMVGSYLKDTFKSFDALLFGV
jgi:uncharacterized protein (TIGR02145 family)